ncbi:Kelch repeat-containing protein [Haliscomenobacter sp.]|uniref:Kelch repeat-containing protein n=1 Tax=Haliscomenobacter sp. TaxID=2717303 RepID=UPI0035943082
MLYQPTLTRFSWGTLMLLLLSLGLGTLSCNLDSDDDDDPLGDWEQINSGFPGVGRNAAVSFTIDNVTYVGLGFDEDGERLSDFWAYNPEQGYWDNLGRLNTDAQARFPGSPRNSAVAFALNGKGYVGLGDNDQDYLADFYEYTPATRSWRKIADFPGGARRGAVAFVIGDKAYVGTGYDDNYLVDMWSYESSSDSWSPVRDFGGSKREGATAVVFNGKAYVGFGNSNGVAQKNLYTFDPQQNSWTEVESLRDDDDDDDQVNMESRIAASAFVLGQRIFFFGGTTGGYYLGDVWAYDPALDTWIEHTGLSNDCGSARATTIVFSYDNVAYLTTGTAGSGRFDDLWVFSPDAEQVDCD